MFGISMSTIFILTASNRPSYLYDLGRIQFGYFPNCHFKTFNVVLCGHTRSHVCTFPILSAWRAPEPLISKNRPWDPWANRKSAAGEISAPRDPNPFPDPGCYYTSVTVRGGSRLSSISGQGRGRRWLRQIPRCKRAYLIRDIAGPADSRHVSGPSHRTLHHFLSFTSVSSLRVNVDWTKFRSRLGDVLVQFVQGLKITSCLGRVNLIQMFESLHYRISW